MDLKNWFLTLCFLSIETKTNKHSFSCRFIIFLSHWRESTANITTSVEKMELILKFHRFFPHFGGARAELVHQVLLSQRWRPAAVCERILTLAAAVRASAVHSPLKKKHLFIEKKFKNVHFTARDSNCNWTNLFTPLLSGMHCSRQILPINSRHNIQE